ncbi:MAG: hypothetical protein IPH13_02475 [Planctomycetes bacterium]|nr:hypothetical protein [Planctomycetota bacterium]MCC7172699.1 hypothetical protein [Planctomycetota bacterium]
MNYAEYSDAARKANALAELDRLDDAIQAFAALVKEKLSPIDRSLMSYNVFTLHERKGDVAGAEKWIDLAVEFERPLLRIFAAEHKASFLARIGRRDDGRALYEELLEHPAATEAEKERFQQNIAALK